MRIVILDTALAINSAYCVRRLPACKIDIHAGFSAQALSSAYELPPIDSLQPLIDSKDTEIINIIFLLDEKKTQV